MYQNFVKNLGIGPKSYSLFYKEKKFNYFIISGKKCNFKSVENKIRKTKHHKLGHLRVGKNRNSLNYIKNKSLELSQKKIEKLIVIGAGSVIDFSKRIYENLKRKNNKISMWILPSLLGSGSEV